MLFSLNLDDIITSIDIAIFFNKMSTKMQYNGPYPDSSPYDCIDDDLQCPLECDSTFYGRRVKRLAEIASFTESDHRKSKENLYKRMQEWKELQSKENIDQKGSKCVK
jgi:hypothetical protein